MTRSGRRTIFMLVIAAMAMAAAAQQQDPPPTQAQQRPVFRGGTHFVRVDAYPLKDGKIVEGLEPGDFEVFEDGKRQAIESFDFVRFDTFTPEAERREPNTQREGFDKAADPRFRVFVIVVDTQFAGRYDVYWIQKPLVHFLDRVLGSRDLYGFLTTRNSAKDLVLGQKAIAIESQVQDLFRSMNIDLDDQETMLSNCFKVDGSALVPLYFADKTYTALEGVVQQLGSIRQERKNIVCRGRAPTSRNSRRAAATRIRRASALPTGVSAKGITPIRSVPTIATARRNTSGWPRWTSTSATAR